MKFSFDSGMKSYDWLLQTNPGIYNVSFAGTLVENGYVKTSYLVVKITVTPLPQVPINTGPPIFQTVLADLQMEVGSTLQFTFPGFSDPDTDDTAVFK